MSSENGQPPQVQVSVPLVRLPLAGASLRVEHEPGGDGRALIVGPIALELVLPLDGENARMVARELSGGIEIASAIPPRQEP